MVCEMTKQRRDCPLREKPLLKLPGPSQRPSKSNATPRHAGFLHVLFSLPCTFFFSLPTSARLASPDLLSNAMRTNQGPLNPPCAAVTFIAMRSSCCACCVRRWGASPNGQPLITVASPLQLSVAGLISFFFLTCEWKSCSRVYLPPL
ncbi:hypothetical protein B0J18DRAFT_207530 [Chaetomium sp. MPI-SDFR-AT-0129]|nr:hypothetical protein B0J18DRAFT_207530 [Chaetomium sp. MPI-SDFR-AT-0129]